MSIARTQRAALVEALHAAGPDAPTLCEGWTAHDLAAHVWLREREPGRALGIVMAPLSGRTRSRMAELKAERSFTELVDDFAAGPPALSVFAVPVLGDLANGTEYFIHCEDVRRGTEPWEPRDLDPATERWAWSQLRLMGPLKLRRAPVDVVCENTTTGEVIRVGRGPVIVTVAGGPGEFLLWLLGRTATRLSHYGDPDAVARLRGFDLSQ